MPINEKAVSSLERKLNSNGVVVESYGENELFCYVMTDASLFAEAAGIILNIETGKYKEANESISWLGCFNDEAIRAVKEFQRIIKC